VTDIDLPSVIVPLVSLELLTPERLRSPAINHRALETSASNRHYVWIVLEGKSRPPTCSASVITRCDIIPPQPQLGYKGGANDGSITSAPVTIWG